MMKRNMKKIAWVVLFVFIAQTALAGELIRAGRTYVAKEDVRVFTMPEARKLLASLEELDKCKEEIKIYQSTQEMLQKQIATYEESSKLRAEATANYKESFEMLKQAFQETKDAKSLYKDIIELQTKALKQQSDSLNRKDRTSRWQRNAMFLLGMFAPIAGGWAIGRAGQFLKF